MQSQCDLRQTGGLRRIIIALILNRTFFLFERPLLASQYAARKAAMPLAYAAFFMCVQLTNATALF